MKEDQAAVRARLRLIFLVAGVVAILIGLIDIVSGSGLDQDSLGDLVIGVALMVLSRVI
jgi:hypothetical protein